MSEEREPRWTLIDHGADGARPRYGVQDGTEVWTTYWTDDKQIAMRMINQRRKKYPWPDEAEETA